MLLQLSGIGNPADFTKFGIQTRINNTAVGANLVDHVTVALVYSVNTTDTYDDLYRNPTIQANAASRYALNKTGPVSINSVSKPTQRY